jgi:hypothetical protein
MQVNDAFFAGRAGWAEQLLYSVQTLERGNREYIHPKLINKETVDSSIYWTLSKKSVDMTLDLYTIPQLLVDKPTFAKRVRAFTPTRAIDIGIDRDLIVPFSGMPVQSDLMAGNDIDTLEERLAYLLYAKDIHDQLVSEWNIFASIQENCWLNIYLIEGLIDSQYSPFLQGANYQFTQVAQFPGGYADVFFVGQPPWLRGVTRANYGSTITQWLLDAGITDRSGGAAITNDTYVSWLASQLRRLNVDINLATTRNIDPRVIYRYAPVIVISGSGSGDNGGSTGAPDNAAPDPAGQDGGLDLLEKLANNEQPLTADLGDGASNTPINTLPEC